MSLDFLNYLSLPEALGSTDLSSIFYGNNAIVPIVAVFMIWMVFRVMLRMVFPLLLIAAVVFLMLGRDPGVTALMQDTMKSGGAMTGQGWLLPALAVSLLLLLIQGRLFSLRTLLPLGVVLYLLFSRDFRIDSLLKSPTSMTMSTALMGGALGLLLVQIVFGRALNRPQYYRPNTGFAPDLRPLFGYFAVGLAIACLWVMYTRQALLDSQIPDWRSTYGIGVLFAALFALAVTMPPRARMWLVPSFWAVVAVTIGAQIWNHPGATTAASHLGALTRF